MMSRGFQEEFKRIKGNFEKQSNIVFKLLSTFKHYSSSGSSPYLARLLLRLDYNGYLTDLAEKIETEKNQSLLGDHGLMMQQ